MSSTTLVEPECLRMILDRQPIVAELLGKSIEVQKQLGYFHTLREICQQPSTWLRTCALLKGHVAAMKRSFANIRSLTLTGSGSSEYAGDCVRMPLQNELGVVAQAVAGGALLLHGSKALAPGRPGLMVSLARSGDSPESAGVLNLMLRAEPEIRHVVLTCNDAGSLARTYRDNPRVLVIALDQETNDRGLVMTSSFTNLVLAARFAGLLDQEARYESLCEQLSATASQFISSHISDISKIGRKEFNRAVFLGSGSRFAAARECALKMLEMTAGRVSTMCESYLGVRHGPMSFIHKDTLIVCFLSSDPTLRAYESDLMRELDQKELGLLKVVIGESIPAKILRKDDLGLECNGLRQIGDENAPVIDVIAGQLLAFFRCMAEGLRPDSPSEGNVINRVVQTFALHSPMS
jgi:tagatose-6-phosphate ketose/aldose isomerase